MPYTSLNHTYIPHVGNNKSDAEDESLTQFVEASISVLSLPLVNHPGLYGGTTGHPSYGGWVWCPIFTAVLAPTKFISDNPALDNNIYHGLLQTILNVCITYTLVVGFNNIQLIHKKCPHIKHPSQTKLDGVALLEADHHR